MLTEDPFLRLPSLILSVGTRAFLDEPPPLERRERFFLADSSSSSNSYSSSSAYTAEITDSVRQVRQKTGGHLITMNNLEYLPPKHETEKLPKKLLRPFIFNLNTVEQANFRWPALGMLHFTLSLEHLYQPSVPGVTHD